MATKIVKKISMKTICGKVSVKNLPDEGDKPLMRVIGQAKGIKTGTSDYGDWAALTGIFEATNIETGEVYRSGVCFMPEIAQDMVIPALMQDSATAVDFAFEIGAEASEDSSVGYVYTIKPLIEAAESDPLRALSEQVQKSLPAPKEEKAKK